MIRLALIGAIVTTFCSIQLTKAEPGGQLIKTDANMIYSVHQIEGRTVTRELAFARTYDRHGCASFSAKPSHLVDSEGHGIPFVNPDYPRHQRVPVTMCLVRPVKESEKRWEKYAHMDQINVFKIEKHTCQLSTSPHAAYTLRDDGPVETRNIELNHWVYRKESSSLGKEKAREIGCDLSWVSATSALLEE